MKKKTYICPAQKELKIETAPLLDASPGIPIITDGEGDQQLSKGYSANIWSHMKADNDAATAQQADEEEGNF